MIIAQGANIGGWSLYANKGKLKYCYNWGGLNHCYRRIRGPAAGGEHQVRMEFAYAGGGLGKGGKVTLFVDGKKVGEGDSAQPRRWSFPPTTARRRRRQRRAGLPGLRPQGNAFNGRVKGVQLAIADAAGESDHLVSPEDAMRSRWRGSRKESVEGRVTSHSTRVQE